MELNEVAKKRIAEADGCVLVTWTKTNVGMLTTGEVWDESWTGIFACMIKGTNELLNQYEVYSKKELEEKNGQSSQKQ